MVLAAAREVGCFAAMVLRIFEVVRVGTVLKMMLTPVISDTSKGWSRVTKYVESTPGR